MKIKANAGEKTIAATIDLARPGAPKELQLKLRVPKTSSLQSATVNGKDAKLGGTQNDVVIIPAGGQKHFEVVARYS